MSDLIKREDVSKMVFTEGINDNGAVYVSLHEVMYNIRNAPSVEAIPVEWIKNWIFEHPYFMVTASTLLGDWQKEHRKEE